MRNNIQRCLFSLLLLLPIWPPAKGHAANSMAPYVTTPIFMSNAVPAKVLIIFDNSGSMNQMAYWEEAAEHDEGDPWWEYDIVPTTPYDPTRNYYGYFVVGTPGNRVMYAYSSNKLERNPVGEMFRGRGITSSGAPSQSKERIPGR
jgi:hypothetical protein